VIVAAIKNLQASLITLWSGTAKVQVVNAGGATVSTAELAKSGQLPTALVGGKLDVVIPDVSGLALETGGNLDTQTGYLQNISDESSNIIGALTLAPAHAYDTFALDVPFAAGLLEADVGDGAVVVPASRWLSYLALTVSALAGGATSLTWYLAHDAAGTIPITQPATITLLDYLSLTAGSYVLAERLEIQYQRIGLTGPFLIAHVNAGTATLVGRLGHRPGMVG
jgi:hypothetical protein